MLADNAPVRGESLRVNADVLSDAESQALRTAGVRVEVLAEYVDGEREAEVVAAVEAIEAEQPDETIMVEYR